MAGDKMTATEIATIEPTRQSQTVLLSVTPIVASEFAQQNSDCSMKGIEFKNGIVVVTDAMALLNDDEGRDRISTLGKRAKKLRTTCEAEYKEQKRIADEVRQNLLREEKEVQADISKVESRCRMILDTIEAEKLAMAKREQDEIERVRKGMVADVGGIPDFIQGTLGPDFLRVATPQQFSEWLTRIKTMNRQLAEAARLKSEQDERDRIEAERVESERQAAEELRLKQESETQAENKKLRQELADAKAKLAVHDETESIIKAELAADEKQAAIESVDPSSVTWGKEGSEEKYNPLEQRAWRTSRQWIPPQQERELLATLSERIRVLTNELFPNLGNQSTHANTTKIEQIVAIIITNCRTELAQLAETI